MSAFDSLLDHLRRAYGAISEVEEVARHFPEDKFVLANLGALKRDAQDLEAQWEEECRLAQVEICRYRLLPEFGKRYTVQSVTRSLLDFQELFTQIYDSISRGAKQRAKLSKAVQFETAFDFGFSYPGSLGVALTMPSEASFFDGKFDTSVEALLNIVNITNQEEVKGLAHTLGLPVVKKTYDWSSINLISGYTVDISWSSVRGTKRGGLVELSALGRIVDIIGRTSEKERHEYTARGTLVGIDAVKRRFRFVEPDGLDYAGPLADDFPVTQKWAINTVYTASLVEESTLEYATDETRRIYRLRNLTPLGYESDKSA